MAEENKIPPRNTWRELSINQLYDVKYQMTEMYYKMRGAGATFANQYQTFISEIDALILRKTAEAEQDSNQD